MIGLASLRRLGFPTNSTVYKRFNSSINQQAVKPQISQHPRFTAKWWWDQTVVMGVFAVTGSSSMAITRPILRFFDIQGGWVDGPWQWRIASVAITMPVYPLLLVTFGALAGRRPYFMQMANRIYGRPYRYFASKVSNIRQ